MERIISGMLTLSYLNSTSVLLASICSDADAHYTPSGTLVTTLSVATKESWKDANGKLAERRREPEARVQAKPAPGRLLA